MVKNKTEILKLDFKIGDNWLVGNYVGAYHGLFPKWWNKFRLNGRGLLIGEPGKYGKNVKTKLVEEYPEINEIYSVDLQDSDINWDITTVYDKDIPPPFDWIICQAVLEHVTDPPSAMRNMSNILKKGGLWYGQACGSDFKQHRRPIDCYRFLPDALIAFCNIADLEFVDYIWTPRQWIAIYRRI